VGIQNRAHAHFIKQNSKLTRRLRVSEEEFWEKFRLVRCYVVDFEKCVKYKVRFVHMGLSRGKIGTGAGSSPPTSVPPC
jgi:hypothetical protein